MANGQNPITTLLLENGAEVNIAGGSFGNALQAATFGGNKGTVRTLLRKGADVNALGGKFGTAQLLRQMRSL